MQIIDFNKYKKHKPIKFIRKFAKILFALYAIWYLSINYLEYTPKELSNAASQLSNINFTTAKEIPIINDSTIKIESFNAGFVRASKDALSFMDTAGEDILEVSLTYDNPNIRIGQSIILVYNSNSYEYELVSNIGSIYDGSLKSRILNASINQDDEYILVTDEQGYVSGLKLYDDNYTEVFEWFTSKYNIIAAKSSGNNIAAICVHQDDNNFYSSLMLFNKKSQDYIETVDLDGNFPVDLYFLNNSNIVVILENSIYIISISGEILKIEETRDLKAYNISSDYIIFASKNYSYLTEISVLDKTGNLVSTIEVDYDIIDMDISYEYIYILTEDHILKYDFFLNEISNSEQSGDITDLIIHSNGEVYGASSTKLIKNP